MERYANRSGNSGVSGYEIGNGYILVAFTSGRIYEYTYASAGAGNIKSMKVCAESGSGLCGFIQQYVKYKYSRKIR